jgi:hypothetical protein
VPLAAAYGLDRARDRSSGGAAPLTSAPSDPFHDPAVAGKTVVFEVLGSGTADIRFSRGLAHDEIFDTVCEWVYPVMR